MHFTSYKSQQQTEELTTFRPQVLQKEQNFNKIWSRVKFWRDFFSISWRFLIRRTTVFLFSKVLFSRGIEIIQSACKDQFSSSTRCWYTFLQIDRIILFFYFSKIVTHIQKWQLKIQSMKMTENCSLEVSLRKPRTQTSRSTLEPSERSRTSTWRQTPVRT